MKKFLLSCVLALPLAAIPQQKASAWFQFNFNGGFNLSLACQGPCWSFGCCGQPYPGCGDYGCGYGGGYGGWDCGYGGCGYGYPYYGGYGGYGCSDCGYYAGYPVASPSSAPTSQPSGSSGQKTSYYPVNGLDWGYQPAAYSLAPGGWYPQ